MQSKARQRKAKESKAPSSRTLSHPLSPKNAIALQMRDIASPIYYHRRYHHYHQSPPSNGRGTRHARLLISAPKSEGAVLTFR